MVCDMCDMLNLLCIRYSRCCDMFVTCLDTFKQNRRPKNSVHEHVTYVKSMSLLHQTHFYLIMNISHMLKIFL